MAGKYEEGSRRISIFKLRFQAETFSGVVGLGESGDYYGAPAASGLGLGAAPKDSLKPLKLKIATR
jgi:hypothetical protein